MIDSGDLTEAESLSVNSWKGKAMARGVLSATPWAGFSFVRVLWGHFLVKERPQFTMVFALPPLDSCLKSHVINMPKFCGFKDVGMWYT